MVLNSLEAAVDLLEKRGHKYSDRPRFVLWELMGWAPTLTWLRWSPKMLQHRRMLQPPFSRSRVGQFKPVQKREAVRAALCMVRDPEHWAKAATRFAVGVVLDISYGIELKWTGSCNNNNPYVALLDDASTAIGNAGPPASSIVDRWPLSKLYSSKLPSMVLFSSGPLVGQDKWLRLEEPLLTRELAARHLPAWLPFMERLRYARKWRSAIVQVTNFPFSAALREMLSTSIEKTTKPSFVRERLDVFRRNQQAGVDNDFGMDDIKGSAATILIAGSDTTATTVRLFILYMMQNPRVQKRARTEIDRAIGTTTPTEMRRLPTWGDMNKLPYLALVLQEVYRSNPLSPLGIPHATLEDDEYRGMLIPKGTVVYPNAWAMAHDPLVYSAPDEFLPERYMPRGSITIGQTKDDAAPGRGESLPIGNFGFGRRICIGRTLAENSLLIVFATILATLEIGPPGGEDGQEDQDVQWSFRGQAYPLPFRCSIVPRSDMAIRLLEDSAGVPEAT
ncbi:hypothetical protein MCOR18_007080 [Pyricularia oryzae]|nr:hypothetical protein MCOR18_007080 [Pyricularia oryzae]